MNLYKSRYSLVFLLAGALPIIGCTSGTEPHSPKPASIEAVTATELAGLVNQQVTTPPAVRVKDGAGNAMPGVAVAFNTVGSSGSSSRAIVTDQEGVARVVSWTLGTQAGNQYLIATVPTLTAVTFRATAEPAAFAQLLLVGGDRQTGVPGEPLPVGLSVRTADAYGNPVASVGVALSVTAGEGTIDETIIFSNRGGTATSRPWTLGIAKRFQYVTARAGERQVAFEAIAPGVPCEIECSDAAIAFERSGRLMALSDDGLSTRDLARGKFPSWSRDGTHIVYADGARLWIPDVRTGEQWAPVSSHDGQDSYPSWSPDGSQIAFVRWLEGGDESVLVIMNLGDRQERVVSRWWPVDGKISWSPDAQQIAFTCMGPHNTWENDICIVPTDPTKIYNYTNVLGARPFALRSDRSEDSDPAWSPSGSLITFSTNQRGSTEVVVSKPDGTGFVFLGPGHHPAWSHNGSQIIFAGNAEDPGLHVMSVDGTGRRQLTDNFRDNAPSWR